MSDHVADLIPFFVNDTLSAAERRTVITHLEVCSACRSQVAEWSRIALACQSVSDPERAERFMRRTTAAPVCRVLRRTLTLLGGQRRLLPWPWLVLFTAMAAFLPAIGALTGRPGVPELMIWLVGPFLALGAVAALAQPEEAAGAEIYAVTPTSPRTILLARLTLVFTMVAVALGVAAWAVDSVNALELLMLWGAPIAAISGFGLLVAVWTGPSYGQVVAAVLWGVIVADHVGMPLVSSTGLQVVRAVDNLVSPPHGFLVALFALAAAVWRSGAVNLRRAG